MEELELIIIDEISMVRADIVDAVDRITSVLLTQPTRTTFGGKQLLLVGDVFPKLRTTVVKGDEREIRTTSIPTHTFSLARVSTK